MAAASCARRSGERLSFLFAFFPVRLFGPVRFTAGFAVKPSAFFWIGVKDFAVSRALAARAANFLLAFIAFAFVSASSLRLSLASFSGPSCRRASSLRIFFLRVLSFIVRSTLLRPTHIVDLSPARFRPAERKRQFRWRRDDSSKSLHHRK